MKRRLAPIAAPTLTRRDAAAAALALVAMAPVGRASAKNNDAAIFVQVNRLQASRGNARRLRKELLSLPGPVAGCRLYQTTIDPFDADTFWTIELWENAAAHAAAVETPFIRESIARCKLLVRHFKNIVTVDAASRGREGSA